jgi:hypothetical protein
VLLILHVEPRGADGQPAPRTGTGRPGGWTAAGRRRCRPAGRAWRGWQEDRRRRHHLPGHPAYRRADRLERLPGHRRRDPAALRRRGPHRFRCDQPPRPGPAGGRSGGRAGAAGRPGAGELRCRRVPAVRRHHRAAEADHPHARRLRVQRPPQRAGVRLRHQHGVPCHPSGRAQLPARLPRHHRDPDERRPGGAGPLPRSRPGTSPDFVRTGRSDCGRPGGRPAVDRRGRQRAAAPAGGTAPAAGGRRAARTGDRGPGAAGARRGPAAGVRDGRGSAQLHPAGRPGRGQDSDPGTPDVPGRPDPHRRRQRRPGTRRWDGSVAHPRPVHPRGY